MSRRESEERIRIKKGYEFKLIAQMIEDGTFPFLARPVVEHDLREWNGLQLRGCQEEAWREFLSKGAIGIFWACAQEQYNSSWSKLNLTVFGIGHLHMIL